MGGPRRKAVLGLLLLQPDAGVTTDEIAEALWGSEPPPTALAMIQTYVSRLRASFGGQAPAEERVEVIETAGKGYRLHAGDVESDLLESQALLRRARSRLLAGDAVAGCELFELALRPWRWPLLADVSLLRDHAALVRMEEEHARAVCEYAEAASAQGWHDQVLPHLRALTARETMNERVHSCLMIALAGSGQQAAALDTYEALRRRLDDNLGVLPGAVLVEAHGRVLRQDIPRAAEVVGRGSAVTLDPDGPASCGPGAPAPPGPAAPWQLPPTVADFTGRSRELAVVRDWLTPAAGRFGLSVAVISGLPGVGKTALMLRAGHLLRESFPDGQLWAQLGAGSGHPREPAEVLGEWLRALGLHGSGIPGGVEERAALYRSVMAGRTMLVAIDDAASAGQVRPLLPGTDGAAVMVTSRRQLTDVPGARLLALEPLPTQDAVGLLERIAGEQRVLAESLATRNLIEACGALPLAVRMAGARLASRPHLPIAALAEDLGQERRRLDVLRVGELSVRASVASGYEALSEPANQAFRLLGQLRPADIPGWVVGALLGGSATPVLDELVDRCMLTSVGADAGGTARYRMHDLLHAYAAESLTTVPQAQSRSALRRAHQGWLQLTMTASGLLPAEPHFPRRDSALRPGIAAGSTATENRRVW